MPVVFWIFIGTNPDAEWEAKIFFHLQKAIIFAGGNKRRQPDT